MKGYELIKEITERKIKNNTKIKVKMGNTYKATLKYENFMLKWQSGDFDTSILCSAEAEFEVIEENKEIEELGFIEETVKYCDGTGHTNKVNNMASYSDIVISTNEYRPCFVFSQKALFHRWIIKHEMVYKDEYVKGLVEFENGHVAEVDKEDIQFCDNKFKEYNFKESEEK